MLKSLPKINLSTLGLSAVFAAAVFAAPNMTRGAELKFNDKVWPVVVETAELTEVSPVRSEFDLTAAALNTLTGKPQSQKQRLLSPTTAAELQKIATEVNQPPRSAHMNIEDDWAKDFDPGQNGQALDIQKLRTEILKGSTNIDLPVLISYPQTNLKDTNSIGINELVATGESDFSGSTRSRIHNVEVGRSRFNGVIIKQGEEFSFNKYLGEVDGEHGFLPELVIKRTGVVPEFGGGLCQVSSTAFRAAMNAGLNITSRRNHSFAVHYYAPQGSDATIYPGVQDMKFINDTPSNILVWTRIDLENKKLYFDYYGSKDDRVVELDGPYQFDKKASGAMKAVWTKRVTLNGETSEQVFNSTYQPPALFQTATQATTPNPDATQTPVNGTETNPDPNAPAPTPTPAPTPPPTT